MNIVLNALANSIGKRFDENGSLASSGRVDAALLSKLNNLSVYHGTNRPSLAREWLEREFLPIVAKSQNSTEDNLCTVVEHAAFQISKVINTKAAKGCVLVTGGGAKNGFLMERISELTKAEIVIPTTQIVDYKEALIFAFLGVLRMRNEINVLSSVTGAPKDSCSGAVHYP